jgi:hypothetical protein
MIFFAFIYNVMSINDIMIFIIINWSNKQLKTKITE